MFNISEYLKRIKISQTDKSKFKDFIVFVLKEDFSIDLKRDDIDLRSNTLYLKISPIQKNEIFLNKKSLLDKISTNLPNILVKDIR